MLRLPAEQLRAELLKFAKDENGAANINALGFHNRHVRRKWTKILLGLHRQLAQHRFLLEQGRNKARYNILAIKRREKREERIQQQVEREVVAEADKQKRNEEILQERAQPQGESHGKAEEMESGPNQEDSK